MSIEERKSIRENILKHCTGTVDFNKLESAVKDLPIEELRETWNKIEALIKTDSSLKICALYLERDYQKRHLEVVVNLTFPAKFF